MPLFSLDGTRNYSLLLHSSKVFVTLSRLVYVLLDVLTLQLSHSLDLVEVDHEALIVRVIQLDAFSAKYGLMI